jgi:hypothetical protein
MAEQSRWCAHRVDRLAHISSGSRVSTSVSLATASGGELNSRAVLFDVEVSLSDLAAPEPAKLSIELQGIVRRFTDPTLWTFGHPTTLKNQTSDFRVRELVNRSGVVVIDSRSSAATALVLTVSADALLLSPPVPGSAANLVGGRADFDLTNHRDAQRGAKGTFRVGIALAIDEQPAAAEAEARRLAASFSTSVADAAALWERRWQDAFTPDNERYSGHVPTISGDTSVRRLYELSVLSFLSLERRVVDPAVAWSQAYTTGGPRTGVTTCYYWDNAYQATLLSLLDPAYARKYVLRALSQGLNATYEIDYFSGRGEGRWYAFNDMSLITLALTYVKVSGDADILWDKAASTADGDPRPVLCSLLDLATHAPADGPLTYGLADFGGNLNLLECVPQYQHGVPSLNAASGWMRLELASLLEAAASDTAAGPHLTSAFAKCGEPLGVPATASALRADAAHIVEAVQRTYVGGEGVWRSVQPDGKAVAVRTIMDFHTIGTLLGAPAATPTVPAGGLLTSAQRTEMAAFFQKELLASDWVRALSLSDLNVNVSSFRPDHSAIGAYDAWPAQGLETLLTLGSPTDAFALLKAIADGGAATEGPLGQARTLWASDDGKARHNPPRLCNVSVPTSPARCVSRKSNHWQMQAYNAAGAAFANAILRTLFGFQPPLPFGKNANLSEVAIFAPSMRRGFEGSLDNLHWRGGGWSVRSSDAGVRMAKK